jgi:hypothetical protein
MILQSVYQLGALADKQLMVPKTLTTHTRVRGSVWLQDE